MNFGAVLKRFGPFLLTFVAGLAIASFFVSVSAPSFNFSSSKRMNRGHHKCKKMVGEYERLREENLRLRLENEELRFGSSRMNAAPGPEVEVPMPPPPPKAPRVQ